MFSRKCKLLVIISTLLIGQYTYAGELGNISVSLERLKEAQEIVQAFNEGVKQGGSVLPEALETRDFSNLDNYVSAGSAVSRMSSSLDSLPPLLVFVSFSMPKIALTQLAAQVKKAHGVLVLRGVRNKSIKDTIAAMYELSKQGVPAIIHPKLFKEYDVRHVPTFVVNDPDYTIRSNGRQTLIADKMVGNVPLDYVLRRFQDEGSYRDVAKVHLALLEGSK